MANNYNRNRNGQPFDPLTVQSVWNKAAPLPGYDPDYVRQDVCGAPIERRRHGDTGSRYGWEIDHIVPRARNGSDFLSNLQPLQWQNNRSKGDNYPAYGFCAVAGR